MFRDLTLFLGLLLCLQSCNDFPVYEQNTPVSGAQWARTDVKSFDVRIDTLSESVPLYISLRNTGAYPYANLWLFISVERSGRTVFRDTVDFRLALPSGRWTGKSAAGLYENRFLLLPAFAFPDTGSYTFCFEQAMRDETLKGIHDIGLYIPGPESN